MKKEIVIKSNELNSKTVFNSPNKSKIFALIICILQDNQNQEYYSIRINELIRKLQLGKKNDVAIKKICDEMLTVTVDLSHNGIYNKYTVFSNINTKKGGYVSFEINSRIKPFIINQTQKFTKYLLKNIILLKSNYSIRLYELLKQYNSTNWLTIDVDELRNILNATQKSYKEFMIFNRNIIKKSVNEINEKTDIFVSIENIKEGKVVKQLRFSIKNNRHLYDEFYNSDNFTILNEIFKLKSEYIAEIFEHYTAEAIDNAIAKLRIKHELGKINYKNIKRELENTLKFKPTIG